jgi:hypothetical protein
MSFFVGHLDVPIFRNLSASCRVALDPVPHAGDRLDALDKFRGIVAGVNLPRPV